MLESHQEPASPPRDPAKPCADLAPKSAWAEIVIVVATFWGIALFLPVYGKGAIAIAAATLVATGLLMRRGDNWRSLGLRWADTRRDLISGVGMVMLAFAAVSFANAVMMPFLSWLLGAEAKRTFPDVSTFAQYLTVMGVVWTTAAFGEEMLFRGFLMGRFKQAFGLGPWSWVFALIAQAAVFGAVHAYQGIGGVLLTGVVGLVFGAMYHVAKRNLWPLIIAHGLVNSFGITVLHLQATGAIATQ